MNIRHLTSVKMWPLYKVQVKLSIQNLQLILDKSRGSFMGQRPPLVAVSGLLVSSSRAP